MKRVYILLAAVLLIISFAGCDLLPDNGVDDPAVLAVITALLTVEHYSESLENVEIDVFEDIYCVGWDGFDVSQIAQWDKGPGELIITGIADFFIDGDLLYYFDAELSGSLIGDDPVEVMLIYDPDEETIQIFVNEVAIDVDSYDWKGYDYWNK